MKPFQIVFVSKTKKLCDVQNLKKKNSAITSYDLTVMRGSDGRIRGLDAHQGQFTWQVSLKNQYGAHFCGGCIINVRWILTATVWNIFCYFKVPKNK